MCARLYQEQLRGVPRSERTAAEGRIEVGMSQTTGEDGSCACGLINAPVPRCGCSLETRDHPSGADQGIDKPWL